MYSYLLAHYDHHYCKQVVQKPCWDRSQLNPTCTCNCIGYLSYLHLGLGSASALGNNKDILLMVEFNYNIFAEVVRPLFMHYKRILKYLELYLSCRVFMPPPTVAFKSLVRPQLEYACQVQNMLPDGYVLNGILLQSYTWSKGCLQELHWPSLSDRCDYL